MSEKFVGIVAVDASALGGLTVDEDYSVYNFDLAHTYVERDMLAARGKLKTIKSWGLIGPKERIFNLESDFAAFIYHFCAAEHNAVVGSTEGSTDIAAACGFKLYRNVRFGEAVVEDRLYEYVADVFLISEEKIYFAEDARHTEHILVFDIASVAPF